MRPWVEISLPDRQNNKKAANKKSLNNDHFDGRYERLHRAILSGLFSNVANKSPESDYLAAKQRWVTIFPASTQAKRTPRWIVCGSFLETSKLFAHTVAQIKPEWIIEAGKDYLKYSYGEPSYHIRSGQVIALRTTTLFGLELNSKQRVNYAPISAHEAREIFVQEALVQSHYQPRSNQAWAGFYAHNQQLFKEIDEIEHKTRTTDFRFTGF